MTLRDLSKVNKRKPLTREERLAKARKSTGGPAPRKQLVCRNYRINHERRLQKKYSKKSQRKIEQLYPSSSDSEVEIPPSLENSPVKKKDDETPGTSKREIEPVKKQQFITTEQWSCSDDKDENKAGDDNKENEISYVFEPSAD